jgi:predicted membrane metal-binding protein
MRASGLAHILSISGLHMAIVGGFVFAGGAAAGRRSGRGWR